MGNSLTAKGRGRGWPWKKKIDGLYFSFSRSALVLACSLLFSERTKRKNKTMSVYRLQYLSHLLKHRPVSYPGHQHFGLKIGTVSSCYCGHPWDSKFAVGNSKSNSRSSFRTKSVTNFCPEFCHCPYYSGSCASKVCAMQTLTVCASCVNCCSLTLSSTRAFWTSWIPEWA